LITAWSILSCFLLGLTKETVLQAIVEVTSDLGNEALGNEVSES